MRYTNGLKSALAPLKSAASFPPMLTWRRYALLTRTRFHLQGFTSDNQKFLQPTCLAPMQPMLRKTYTNEIQNDESPLQSETDDIKDRILSASLKHVNESGWSEQAIVQGVKDCGYSVSAHSMFPRVGGDLALYFYRTSNEKLRKLLEEQKSSLAPDKKLNVGIFVKDAVRHRVRMTSEYSSTWPSAIAQLSHPSCAAESLGLLGELVDEIWHLAGDRSFDMSWYTKRVLLAAIYKSSELFMLQDKSSDFEETDKFIDRRFEDQASLTSVISNITSVTPSDITRLTRSGYTVGTNILGLKHFT